MKMPVKKETIDYYSFPTHDVLNDSEEKQKRNKQLQKALILGNRYKQKVRITFYIKHRAHAVYVETTVWALDECFVFLKGNRVIPVKAIESVQI